MNEPQIVIFMATEMVPTLFSTAVWGLFIRGWHQILNVFPRLWMYPYSYYHYMRLALLLILALFTKIRYYEECPWLIITILYFLQFISYVNYNPWL